MAKELHKLTQSLLRKPKEIIGKPWTYSADTLHKLEQEKAESTVTTRVDYKGARKEKPFTPTGPRKGKYDAKVRSQRDLPAPFVAPKAAIARKRKLPKLVIKASIEIHTFGKKARVLKRLKKERFKI